MGQARKRGTYDRRRAEAFAREAQRDGRDAAARVGVPRVAALGARPLPNGQRSKQPGQRAAELVLAALALVASTD